ncbi:MAG: exodeoxyribonuclease III [Angelakisella sp.]|jgi:exodeoxyribonuclease-3|nr:exodeoxyribonuclease III [Angelakisella sp.]
MKLISWNVNGLRACLGKGFPEFVSKELPDLLALQEVKMEEGQAELPLPPGYRVYWNSAERKGYSGTAVLARTEPLSVSRGMGVERHDHEGRILTLEYPDFWFVCVYTPNSQQELARLSYRMEWEDDFRGYLLELDRTKPVILCGDLNVAHKDIDLKNPGPNRKNPGFTQEERDKLTALLEAGFVDTFRHFYPDRTGAYSWWSYRFRAREKNAGWRIDYFLISQRLVSRLDDAVIYQEVTGSDHCPVGLLLKTDQRAPSD